MELPEDSEEGWSADPVPGALSFDPVTDDSKIQGESDNPVWFSEDKTGRSNESTNEATMPLSDEETALPDSLSSEPQRSDSKRSEDDTDAAGSANTSEDDWDVAGLDDDWQSLAAILGSNDRQMLRAVLLHASDAERMSIAGATGELPETVIDRINEAAMETIGDLLIDAGEVLEEYVPILERLYER